MGLKGVHRGLPHFVPPLASQNKHTANFVRGVQKVFKDRVFMLFAEECEEGVHLRKRTL
jgi:hypothetical protein